MGPWAHYFKTTLKKVKHSLDFVLPRVNDCCHMSEPNDIRKMIKAKKAVKCL